MEKDAPVIIQACCGVTQKSDEHGGSKQGSSEHHVLCLQAVIETALPPADGREVALTHCDMIKYISMNFYTQGGSFATAPPAPPAL